MFETQQQIIVFCFSFILRFLYNFCSVFQLKQSLVAVSKSFFLYAALRQYKSTSPDHHGLWVKDGLEQLLQIIGSSIKCLFTQKARWQKWLLDNEHRTCDAWTKNFKQLSRPSFTHRIWQSGDETSGSSSVFIYDPHPLIDRAAHLNYIYNLYVTQTYMGGTAIKDGPCRA